MGTFPDAVVADFDGGRDTTCIICHEEMVETENDVQRLTGPTKKLPCSHMFHAGCLRSWFLRQQTCPICRMNVLEARSPTPAANRNPNINPAFAALPRNAQEEAQRIQNIIRDIQGRGGNDQQAAQGLENVNLPLITETSTSSGEVFKATWKIQIPNNPPIPRPPIDLEELSKLSDAELLTMEGKERAHVIKRIEYLRQVRSLCDASLTMMSQYESLTNTNNLVKSVQIQTDPVSTAVNDEVFPSSSPITKTTTTTPSTSSSSKDNTSSETTEKPEENKENPEEAQNELRQRRVQAFSSSS